MGTELGTVEGCLDSSEEGFPLGESDGSPDGCGDGFKLGTSLGPEEGVPDGRRLGDSDGGPDGRELGISLGTSLGTEDGAPDGLALGESDGSAPQLKLPPPLGMQLKSPQHKSSSSISNAGPSTDSDKLVQFPPEGMQHVPLSHTAWKNTPWQVKLLQHSVGWSTPHDSPMSEQLSKYSNGGG